MYNNEDTFLEFDKWLDYVFIGYQIKQSQDLEKELCENIQEEEV